MMMETNLHQLRLDDNTFFCLFYCHFLQESDTFLGDCLGFLPSSGNSIATFTNLQGNREEVGSTPPPRMPSWYMKA